MTSSERGSSAIELAVIAPALVALMLLVVVASRVSDADAAVRDAASDAARAASLQRTAGSATVAATESVASNLDARLRCDRHTTTVDTASFEPGGRVLVAVECTIDMSDVALLAVPGSRTFRAEGIEVIDRYRAAP